MVDGDRGHTVKRPLCRSQINSKNARMFTGLECMGIEVLLVLTAEVKL